MLSDTVLTLISIIMFWPLFILFFCPGCDDGDGSNGNQNQSDSEEDDSEGTDKVTGWMCVCQTFNTDQDESSKCSNCAAYREGAECRERWECPDVYCHKWNGPWLIRCQGCQSQKPKEQLVPNTEAGLPAYPFSSTRDLGLRKPKEQLVPNTEADPPAYPTSSSGDLSPLAKSV